MFKFDGNRFYLNNDQHEKIAEITFFKVSENVINVDHTFVDASLRGQGIALKLVDRVVLMAREEGLKIIPTCPYVIKVFQTHDAYTDVWQRS